MEGFEEVYVREDRRARKAFSRVGWACFTVLGTAYALQIAGAVAVRALAPSLLQTSWFSVILTLVPMYFIAFPVGFLILRAMPASVPEPHAVRFGTLAVFLLMSVCVMYVGNFIGVGVTTGIDSLKGTQYVNPVDQVLSNWNIYINIAALLIIAPVLEETLFRKYLIDRLRVYGEGTAIVLSGLLFGLFHGNLSQFFYAFGIGCLFAYIYLRTGKLRYTIALHATINFFGGVLSEILLKWLDNGSMPELRASNLQAILQYAEKNPGPILAFGFYAMLIMLAFVSGLILLLQNRKKAVLLPAEKQLPEGTAFRTAWLNTGMLVFSVLSLALIVYSAINK